MANMNSPSKPFQVTQIQARKLITRPENVIVEKLVSLTVNGELWLSFMCTPIDLESLAIGFLYNEGIITKYSDIENIIQLSWVITFGCNIYFPVYYNYIYSII